MKEFLRKEKYTEGEIDMIYNKVCGRNEYLMKKYMIRLKIAHGDRQDQRLLPIVLNRWKEYVAVRKSVRYQFRVCHNNVSDEQRKRFIEREKQSLLAAKKGFSHVGEAAKKLAEINKIQKIQNRIPTSLKSFGVFLRMFIKSFKYICIISHIFRTYLAYISHSTE